jgi:hypothetical protein
MYGGLQKKMMYATNAKISCSAQMTALEVKRFPDNVEPRREKRR